LAALYVAHLKGAASNPQVLPACRHRSIHRRESDNHSQLKHSRISHRVKSDRPCGR